MVTELVPEIVKTCVSAWSSVPVGSRSRIWIDPDAAGPDLDQVLVESSVLPPMSEPLIMTSEAEMSTGSSPRR